MSWSIDPRRFTDVMEQDVAKLRTRMSLDVLRGVIRMTPIDTGRARGSWNVSHSVIIPLDMIRSSSDALSDGMSKLARKANSPYEKTIISNTVPYIVKLENGSSRQSPQGMADVTVQSVKAKYRR